MRLTLLLVLILLSQGYFSSSLLAQTIQSSTNPWTFVPENTFIKETDERVIIPEKYLTVQLDLKSVQSVLDEVPQRFSQTVTETEALLTLPLPNGQFENFRIQNAPLMHPDLAAKYPEIQTFVGYGVEDPTAEVRLDLTPHGFHAMMRSGKHSTVFIEPFSKNETEFYTVFYKRDHLKSDPFDCATHIVTNAEKTELLEKNVAVESGDCQLRTYRLALACTGEYAAFHGGTKALVLAAFNTTMNRVNGIFENDVNVTMELVSNTDLLIFLDADTDPYTNDNGSSMLSENQTTCDNTIGSGNYDIGHVFSTGGGGVAYLNSVCSSTFKAGGVTGQSNPIGDGFDVDYVAHEIGHQFGATHTQNNSCNRTNSSAMETGSGSTIMGYAGICAPNVQNNSDDYFHAMSIQQISTFITGSGNSCAALKNTGNNAPTANAGNDFTIPHSTPFILEGSGSDADGNGNGTLTYCWEQIDNTVANQPPQPTNTGGPIFRSYPPSVDAYRYFPSMSGILGNSSTTWEVLPSIARIINFRLTVRDNQAGGSCAEEDDMVVTVEGEAGPFVLNTPNGAENWPALSQQTVTWDVANTDLSPINATTVDILLSIDGGQTFSTSLLTATPNDGSATVVLPNNTTSEARIMVRGSNNIFFDISDKDFTVGAPIDDFLVQITPASQVVCIPENIAFNVAISTTGNFTEDVSLDVVGLPAGLSADFSEKTVASPGASQLTIGNTINATPGTYEFEVNASGSTGTKTATATLIIATGGPSSIVLSAPANGITGLSNNPTLEWEIHDMTTSYEVQIATDEAFTNIIESATSLDVLSYTPSESLSLGTTYFWRVRGVNDCGNGTYASPFTFTMAGVFCETFEPTDLPIVISSSTSSTNTSSLTISENGSIEEVRVIDVDVSHTWVNDLIISVTSPTGTTVELLNQVCGSEDNLLLSFDDAASNTYASIPCPPVGGAAYQPNSPLSKFLGEEIQGEWTLTVQDLFSQDGGSFNSWALEICYKGESTDFAISANGTDLSCEDSNDGTAMVAATGGTPPYTYNWSNGATTNTISNLAADTYTINVSDANGNTASTSVQIAEPNALALFPFSTNTSCGENNGQAGIETTGGTPPYEYIWNNAAEEAFIEKLAPGNYFATVSDANGCSATQIFTINDSDALNVMASWEDVSCNGNQDGSATIIVVNGSGNYTYGWTNGASTSTVEGLGAGIYGVEIIDNITQCVGSATITIVEPSAMSINISTTDTSCEEENGTATTSVSGGTPPYSYAWDNGESTDKIDNLPAGTYILLVTDANNCTKSETVTIAGSNKLNLTTTSTSVSCQGEANGTASVNVLGGSGTYIYAWSNGGSSATITGLAASTYTVLVTDDSTGCTATAQVIINAPTTLNVSINSTHTSCNNSNGTAAATVEGGTLPYSYEWSNNEKTTSINNLEAGNYSVTITDGNSCTTSSQVTIEASEGLALTFSNNNVQCHEESNGAAEVNVSGGSGNYSYFWSNGATAHTIANLNAGIYSVEVIDNETNCFSVGSITISEPIILAIDITSNDASCGKNNGQATAIATGGTAPYSYLWDDGSTDTSIDDLSAGEYIVEVEDANGCQIKATAFINGTSSLDVNVESTQVTCSNNQDGTATATIFGGSGNYSYLWNTGATTASISNLATGNYTVEVTDQVSGCAGSGSASILAPSPIIASATATDTDCGLDNGSATASGSGGTPDPISGYTYQWSNGDTAQTIYNLPSGNYSFTIVDRNGCSTTAQTTVEDSENIQISINITAPTCNEGSNGSVTATVTGGSGDYTYLWSNEATGATANGLSAGSYGLEVIDNQTECMASTIFQISEPSVLTASITPTDASCGNTNGSATASVTGGTPPYSYLWSTNANTSSIDELAPSDYFVEIIDANGCIAVANTTIFGSEALELDIFATAVTCFNSSNGTAAVFVLNDSLNYSYQWSNGSTNPNIDNLPADTYSVVVTEEVSGCTGTASVIVQQTTELSVTIAGSSTTCAQDNGAATAQATGGAIPYTYEWSNLTTGATTQSLAAGNYAVTVTDVNGCTATANINIGDSETLNISASTTDVTCHNSADGIATINVSGGSGSYTYFWEDVEGLAIEEELSAGTYTVFVIDNQTECSGEVLFTIDQPSALFASIVTSDATCGEQNGTAMASVMGGTAPYTYQWNNGATTQNIQNLAANDYAVIVTDVNGCTTTASKTIISSGSLAIEISSTDASCHNSNDGTATAIGFGGSNNYIYDWSNGAFGSMIENLAPGTYEVTVTDINTGCTIIASTSLIAPSEMTLNMIGTDATNTNNGSANLTVSGGTPPYTYLWTNNANTEDIFNLSAGSYTVEVMDASDCVALASVTINASTADAVLTLENGFIENVSEQWQTIVLNNYYQSPVIVASVVMPNSSADPVVTRLQNISNSSFELKIQNPGGSTSSSYDVHYFVVEEGVYNYAEHGIDMEAIKASASSTAGRATWKYEARNYLNSYINPVVVGQVMSYNDSNWSVFWASRNGSRTNPPNSSSFAAGKMVAEDTNKNRASETIGYIVIEDGIYNVNGINIEAGLGQDIVRGTGNSAAGYSYPLSLPIANGAVVSSAASDGGDGGWPVLFGTTPVMGGNLMLSFDEDQIRDTERKHTTEQVAYVAFGNAAIRYCGSNANSSSYEYIKKVQIGNINNTSGNDGGYGDYADMVLEVAPNENVSLTLTPGFTFGDYPEFFRVWIDFNFDGDFEDDGEEVFAADQVMEAISGSFTIPDAPYLGAVPMRVSMKWGNAPEPCESFGWGEVEDYTVLITNPLVGTEAVAERTETVPFFIGAPLFHTHDDRFATPNLKIYPNPASEQLTLEYELFQAGTARALVFDLMGNIVFEKEIRTETTGSQELQIDVRDWATGQYFLRVINTHSDWTTKFIILAR